MVAICGLENTADADQSSFWDKNGIHRDTHRIGWPISGALALATVIITLVGVSRHARNYHKPKRQRQIIRIWYMPLVNVIISWLSYQFFRAYSYYYLVVVVYEAFTILAFRLFIIQYVSNTASRTTVEGALARILACCWCDRPTKEYLMYAVKWSVLQYVIVRPTVSIIGIICEALHILCRSSWSYKHPSVYLSAVDFVSIIVAFCGLILFYVLMRRELLGHRPRSKFFAIIYIVISIPGQKLFFDAVQHSGIIKATRYSTVSNISDDLNALTTIIKMVSFALFMMWAYPVSEYARPERARISAKRAIIQSLNFSDFVTEI